MSEHEIYYQALVQKDISFEGRFIAAVKTTGIFCRPTCRAKKPRKENVEFFTGIREAIQHGYRPCKICKPMESPGNTPSFIAELIQELADDPTKRIKEWDLRKKGLDPTTIRRWFLKNHSITFHSYQRMLRINTAFTKIRAGEAVSSVAFDTGFESLSGFSDSFRSVYGVSPSNSRKKQVIYIWRFETPLGPMMAAATDEGLCLLEFTDRRMLETELKTLSKVFNATMVQGKNNYINEVSQQMTEYFSGDRKEFDIKLISPGTVFQLQIWTLLQSIPYGETISYQELATRAGSPLARRAAGTANGMNRIAIIIPCHRVVRENGELSGYAGGLWRKQWLLDFERRMAGSNER